MKKKRKLKLNTPKTPARFFNRDGYLFERLSTGIEQKLGAMLRVVAFADVEGSEKAFVVIIFKDYDGKIVTTVRARSEVRTKAACLSLLADLRYILPAETKKEEAIFEYIKIAKPKKRQLILRRPGWKDGKFAFIGVTIGEKDDDNLKISYQPGEDSFVPAFGTKSTLEQWKESVAGTARHSITISFATCVSLAAPLIGFCNLEGGGFHLFGPTTAGKTLGSLAAQSVWGVATRDNLVKWQTTGNAVERVAFAHNDCFLAVDDTSHLPGTIQQQAQMMRDIAYKLPDGQGKMRLCSTGRGWEVKTSRWRLLFLSNGEQSIADIVKAGGETRHGGGTIRFVDVPVVAHPTFGIFEELPAGCQTFDDAVLRLETACRDSYGTPIRKFLQWIISKPKTTRRLVPELMREFGAAALVSTDRWEQRFADKFAVAYAAGVLAITAGVLPWTKEHIRSAILTCYRRARTEVPDASALIERGMAIFNRNLASAEKVLDLRPLSPTKRKGLEPDFDKGYLRDREDIGPHLAILPKTFQSWFDRPQEAQLVLQELERTQRLLRDPTHIEHVTRQILMPWGGAKKRWLVVKLVD